MTGGSSFASGSISATSWCRADDLLGDGVNVAARLQGAAEPGGICIAGSVYDQIRNKLSLAFTPLGDVTYKNIPRAVRTFAIAEADGLGVLPSPTGRFAEPTEARFSGCGRPSQRQCC